MNILRCARYVVTVLSVAGLIGIFGGIIFSLISGIFFSDPDVRSIIMKWSIFLFSFFGIIISPWYCRKIGAV